MHFVMIHWDAWDDFPQYPKYQWIYRLLFWKHLQSMIKYDHFGQLFGVKKN